MASLIAMHPELLTHFIAIPAEVDQKIHQPVHFLSLTIQITLNF